MELSLMLSLWCLQPTVLVRATADSVMVQPATEVGHELGYGLYLRGIVLHPAGSDVVGNPGVAEGEQHISADGAVPQHGLITQAFPVRLRGLLPKARRCGAQSVEGAERGGNRAGQRRTSTLAISLSEEP